MNHKYFANYYKYFLAISKKYYTFDQLVKPFN
jgi:hypothetical protein